MEEVGSGEWLSRTIKANEASIDRPALLWNESNQEIIL